MKIGLLSDTHSYLDDRILAHLSGCDEIWHAGDFGTAAVSERLSEIALVRGVYGNIDAGDVRALHPKNLRFNCAGLEVLMTHIGGYPGKYAPEVRTLLKDKLPDLFICGHSHILKVMTDPKHGNLLHLNPGAAGRHGFHQVRTMMRFSVQEGKVKDLQVIELGKRA
ncbi:metallophosphoesterase [Rufibacter glacialis]|uniref:Phosphoesterase n=1 Tax=Rufibacter glacialis TaxID=1259555 RepID=A0A5M8QHX0_9BACT|nr:metallophosphoesterase family protein [Rufibacter glacialis]KAA6434540.1 metallophosphoesterase family protein [Rufibacter glacialis]GGK70482.1 phosphoesterase [Rufibacter glacialis]